MKVKFIPVQVHADHLCCLDSHFGNWPMPPPNAILAPPFLTPSQVAKLVSHRTLRRVHPRHRMTSRSDCDETEDESGDDGKPKKVKKRRTKEPAGTAETSDDEDEQSPQQRKQRRRRTVLGQVKRVPPLTSDDEVDLSEEIGISSEWKTFNKSEKTTPTEHDYWCHLHYGYPLPGISNLEAPIPGIYLTDSSGNEEEPTHACGGEATISEEIGISSEWTTFNESEEKTAEGEEVRGLGVGNLGGGAAGSMKGGAGETYEEQLIKAIQRTISEEIGISSEWKTFNESEEKTTEGAEDRGLGVGNLGGGAARSMRGGAGETYEEQLIEAIQRSGQHLKLDRPTRGDGNCCSRALIQQCQRAPVKLFLQSRGVTINTFMQLKQNVAQFIKANLNTQKVRNMVENFNHSQRNMHLEGLRSRTWRKYWSDMQKNAEDESGERWWECWADDTWLQAASWYLDMPIVIIWAGDATERQVMSTTDGTWSPIADGEVRPFLYLGYIVRAHYQSLLPCKEERIPQFVAKPAVDKTLQDILCAFETAKAKQGTQVNFCNTIAHIELVELFDTS